MNASKATNVKKKQAIKDIVHHLWIGVNKSLMHLGVVAHECNVFTVCRHLVVKSPLIVLRWR